MSCQESLAEFCQGLAERNNYTFVEGDGEGNAMEGGKYIVLRKYRKNGRRFAIWMPQDLEEVGENSIRIGIGVFRLEPGETYTSDFRNFVDAYLAIAMKGDRILKRYSPEGFAVNRETVRDLGSETEYYHAIAGDCFVQVEKNKRDIIRSLANDFSLVLD